MSVDPAFDKNHFARIARQISRVENEADGYEEFMAGLRPAKIPLIGITGPPGAGKSTLINALAGHWLGQNKKVAILAVDPSSPFNRGALMGDRLRMSAYFLHPNLFIRSMASRGSLGGLAPRIFEVADVLRSSGFDYVIIETVGVGQSEVEIATLADTTVLVLVPEAGDEIQTIKSGVMEIADIYVLNKADREGANVFLKNLQTLAHQHASASWEAPVLPTVATTQSGIEALSDAIIAHSKHVNDTSRKVHLMAQRALMMIKELRTRNIQIEALERELERDMQEPDFNLFHFISKYK